MAKYIFANKKVEVAEDLFLSKKRIQTNPTFAVVLIPISLAGSNAKILIQLRTNQNEQEKLTKR